MLINFNLPSRLVKPILILFLAAQCHCLFAIETEQSGPWHATSTWKFGVIPGPGDDVLIKEGHTVTMEASASCDGINIEEGGKLILVTYDLTYTGGINIDGELEWGGSNLNGTGTIFNSGTLTLYSSGNHNTGSDITNLLDGTIHWLDGWFDKGGGGQTITNYGDFNLIAENPGNYRCHMNILNKSGGIINKGGITNANLQISYDLTNELGAFVTVGSNASLTFGLAFGERLVNEGSFNVLGTLTFNGATDSLTLNGGSFGGTGVLNLDGTLAVTIPGNFAPTFSEVNHHGALSLTDIANTLTIPNGTNWNWEDGSFNNFASITNNGTLNIIGVGSNQHNTGTNITNNAGKTINWNAGKLDDNGGGQTLTNYGTLNIISGSLNRMPFINKSGGSIIKGGGNSMYFRSLTNEFGGTLTIEAGATGRFGTGDNLSNDGIISVAGTFVFEGGSHTFGINSIFGGTGILNIINSETTTVTAAGSFFPEFATVNHSAPLAPGAATSVVIPVGTTWNFEGSFGSFIAITNNGTLNVNGANNNNFGADIINNAGKTINWNAGHFDQNAGGQTLTNFGTLNLIGNNSSSKIFGMAVVNKNGGSILKGGSTIATLTLSYPFTNEDGGTVSIGAGAAFTFSGSSLSQSGVFTVDGTLSVNNTVLTQTQPFTINGTCNLLSGTYTFGANSGFGGAGLVVVNHLNGNATFNSGCTFTTQLTLTLGTLNDNVGLAPPVFIQSGGTYQGAGSPTPGTMTQSGGIFRPDGTVTLSGNLSLSGGTFDPDGNVSVGTSMNWSGGAIGTSGAGSTASIVNVPLLTTLVANNATLSLVKKTLNLNGGAEFTGNSTINISLSNNATLNLPVGQTFTDGLNTTHTISGAAGNAFNLSGTYQKTGSGQLTINVPFDNTGTFNVTGGKALFSNTSSQSGTLTNAATDGIQFSAGTHTLTGPSITGGGSLVVSGGTATMSSDLVQPLTMSGGTFQGAFNSNTTEITQSGGTFQPSGTVALSGNLSISGGTFQPGGTATIGGNLSLSVGTFNPPGAATIGGVLNWTSGTIGGSTGSVSIAGLATMSGGTSKTTSAKTLNLDGGASWTGGNLSFNSSADLNLPAGQTFTADLATGYLLSGGTGSAFSLAGTFEKLGAATLTCNLPLTNTGALNVSAGTFILSNSATHSGTFEVGSGTTLNFSNTSANTTLTGAAFTNNGTVSVGTGRSLVFAGVAQQTLAGNGTSIAALTVNNPADLNITGSQSVSGTMTLTSGKVHLQNGDLTLNALTGADATRYFVTFGTGRLVLTAPLYPANKVFPVGPSTSSYNPVTLAQVDGAGNATYGVRVKIGFDQPIGVPEYVNRQWTIDNISGTADANVTLQWNSPAHATGGFDPDCVAMTLWNGSSWQPLTNGPANTVGSDHSVTANGIESFGDFSIINYGCSTVLNLEGTFIGGYMVGVNEMNTVLMNSGVLGATATQCDSIIVALHDDASPYTELYRDTCVLNTDGTSDCSFPAAAAGSSYYVAIKGRNIIETWSSVPVVFTFTTGFDLEADGAYGENLFDNGSNLVIYSGDIDDNNSNGMGDGEIEFTDYDGWVSANGETGYLRADLNGDGEVEFLDLDIWVANNGLTVIIP